jgi:S1-C subfamily serine protease
MRSCDPTSFQGRVVRGFLGVYSQPLSPDLVKAFKLTDEGGALIGGVPPGTPAAQAGLKEGDVLLEINRKKVRYASQLSRKIKDRALLRVWSKGGSRYFVVNTEKESSN